MQAKKLKNCTKTGVDIKSGIMAFMLVPVKIGLIVKAGIISAFLVSIQYDASVPDLTVYGASFNRLYLMIPAIISLIGGLLIFFGYHLNEQKVAQYAQENEARLHAASQSTDSAS